MIVGIKIQNDCTYRDKFQREQIQNQFNLFVLKMIWFSLIEVHCRFETVTFIRPKDSATKHGVMQQNTGLMEAIILEVKDRERIGGSSLKSDLICCNPELSDATHCKVGEVIIQNNPDNPELPKRIKTFFQGNSEQVIMETQTVQINKTGMYYLYFMFCDPELKGTIIKGRTVWRNPNGYLPGKMAPLMTFYGFMSLAYLLLGLVWFLRFVQFWKDIIHLHYHITAVIALGMCEMAVWYFEYANFNSTGTRPMGITLWAVTFSSVKKTLSRLLLLVVSMGFGVVRPTLGGITSRVLLLGLVYFIASEALELVEHLGNINDFSGNTKLVLVLPVVCLDSCFILWIFSSLSKTLEKLQVISVSRALVCILSIVSYSECINLSVLVLICLHLGYSKKSIWIWILVLRLDMLDHIKDMKVRGMSLFSICVHFWMQTRRNLAKLELYRKFTNTLAVSVLLSIAWIGFEVVFRKDICWIQINSFIDAMRLTLYEYLNIFIYVFLCESILLTSITCCVEPAILQCNWPIEWAVANCLDHSSFLVFACLCSLVGYMCPLGAFSQPY